MARSVENWKDILYPLVDKPLPKIALWILDDLTHYNSNSEYQYDDCQNLSNAMLAWEEIVRKERCSKK